MSTLRYHRLPVSKRLDGFSILLAHHQNMHIIYRRQQRFPFPVPTPTFPSAESIFSKAFSSAEQQFPTDGFCDPSICAPNTGIPTPPTITSFRPPTPPTVLPITSPEPQAPPPAPPTVTTQPSALSTLVGFSTIPTLSAFPSFVPAPFSTSSSSTPPISSESASSSTIQGPVVTPSGSPPPTHSSNLNNGIIIGSVAAILVALTWLICVAIFFIRRRKQRKAVEEKNIKPTAYTLLDNDLAQTPIDPIKRDRSQHPPSTVEQGQVDRTAFDVQQKQRISVAPVAHIVNRGQSLPSSSIEDPLLFSPVLDSQRSSDPVAELYAAIPYINARSPDGTLLTLASSGITAFNGLNDAGNSDRHTQIFQLVSATQHPPSFRLPEDPAPPYIEETSTTYSDNQSSLIAMPAPRVFREREKELKSNESVA